MTRRLLWVATLATLMPSGLVRAQIPATGRANPTPVIAGIYPPGASRGGTVEWILTGRGFARAKQVIGLGAGIELIDFAPIGDTQARVSIKIAADAPSGYRELRVDGPDGISNLVLVRIDTLNQVIEAEPNDSPEQAIEIGPGTAVVGILRQTDLDYVRIKGKPGQRLTIDLEARRLGTAFSPVVTAMTSAGTSLAQGRERPGGDRDCRFGVTVPPDGVVLVSVRDNIYGGNDLASYRLRVDTAPFASGMFPLGGAKGKTVEVELSGGSLARPMVKAVALPATSGPDYDLGLFNSPEGGVAAPMRFVVGDANEVIEPPSGASDTPMPIRLGETVNGRIGRPGELDRFRLSVKKGEKFRLKIQAAELGSWIDSVLTIRKAGGDLLVENDDEGNGAAGVQGQRVNALGLTEGSQDSQIDYTPTETGEIIVEVTDRYGSGGPEYPYRLAVGRNQPDFNVTLMLGNPNANIAVTQQGLAAARFAPGLMGVFNLKPGSVTPINFVLKAEGAPGPVTLKLEGLPQGVIVEPVKVDASSSGKPNEPQSRSVADSFVLRVESYADPGMATIRVVATSEPKTGEKITRYATAVVGVQQTNAGGLALPITRTISSFPLRVMGELKTRLVGPPPPPNLLAVTVPGLLLQGDRLDLELQFDQSPLADPGFEFEASAEGVGLATNTVISSGQSSEDDEPKGDVLVRVLASPKAAPGVYPVKVKAKFTGGRTSEQTVSVIVRKPLEILLRADRLVMKPGGTAELWVAVRREQGCDGEIDLKVDELPRGVKLAQPVTLAEGQNEATLKFEMAANARPIRSPREIIVSAVARMPRGAVAIESPIRPMIVSAPAEE